MKQFFSGVLWSLTFLALTAFEIFFSLLFEARAFKYGMIGFPFSFLCKFNRYGSNECPVTSPMLGSFALDLVFWMCVSVGVLYGFGVLVKKLFKTERAWIYAHLILLFAIVAGFGVIARAYSGS